MLAWHKFDYLSDFISKAYYERPKRIILLILKRAWITEMIKEVHFRKKWNQIGKNITFTNYFNLDCPLANKKSLLSLSSEIKGLYLMKLSIVKHI